jgi:MFS family permease
VLSQGGLTESVAAVERGEARSFWSSWRAGARNFWPVLWQILLFVGIVLGILLAAGIPVALLVARAFATDSTALRAAAVIVAVLVAIALLVVVFVLLAIVRQFARRELVLRGIDVVGSVGSGYRLLRRNLGRSLLVWLIQLGLMLAAAIALLIALVIVGFLLFLPTILLAVAQYTTAAIVTGVVAGSILLPLLIVALAVLGTFNHSYWTLAYLRLTNQVGTTRP